MTHSIPQLNTGRIIGFVHGSGQFDRVRSVCAYLCGFCRTMSYDIGRRTVCEWALTNPSSRTPYTCTKRTLDNTCQLHV